jgi:hypothetical protein
MYYVIQKRKGILLGVRIFCVTATPAGRSNSVAKNLGQIWGSARHI